MDLNIKISTLAFTTLETLHIFWHAQQEIQNFISEDIETAGQEKQSNISFFN